jgi:hypothetical protein
MHSQHLYMHSHFQHQTCMICQVAILSGDRIHILKTEWLMFGTTHMAGNFQEVLVWSLMSTCFVVYKIFSLTSSGALSAEAANPSIAQPTPLNVIHILQTVQHHTNICLRYWNQPANILHALRSPPKLLQWNTVQGCKVKVEDAILDETAKQIAAGLKHAVYIWMNFTILIHTVNSDVNIVAGSMEQMSLLVLTPVTS